MPQAAEPYTPELPEGPPRERLLTTEEAAAYVRERSGLEVQRHAVQRWIRDGIWGVKLRARCVGRHYMTTASWLEAFSEAAAKARANMRDDAAVRAYGPPGCSAARDPKVDTDFQRSSTAGSRGEGALTATGHPSPRKPGKSKRRERAKQRRMELAYERIEAVMGRPVSRAYGRSRTDDGATAYAEAEATRSEHGQTQQQSKGRD